MSFIRSADAALYYEEYGAGENLVLLPGLFGTIENDWRRFIPEFSRHFHTIAPDIRGHGKTDNPSGNLSPGRLVSDLLVLFDTLEIDRAFLCTYGVMAFLPLSFAAVHPHRVQGVIVHAPRGIMTGNDIPRGGRISVKELLPPGYSEDTLKQVHGTVAWERLAAQSSGLLAQARIPVGDLLRETNVPVLITGEGNPGLPNVDERPFSQFQTIPGCGHHIAAMPKGPFVSAVLDFAARVPESFPGPDRIPE